MEGDHKRCFNVCPVFIFQSTPSAWRETNCGMSAHGMTAYFNPLPPHGGRLPGISRCLLVPRHFNPLPPHGGRRYACAGVSAGLYISIHSLRMEGDVSFASQISTWKYFNPLPPHGGRPGYGVSESIRYNISIHSLRMEGDTSFPQAGSGRGISIHSLRMEGDMRPCASCRFPNKAVHAIET